MLAGQAISGHFAVGQVVDQPGVCPGQLLRVLPQHEIYDLVVKRTYELRRRGVFTGGPESVGKFLGVFTTVIRFDEGAGGVGLGRIPIGVELG